MQNIVRSGLIAVLAVLIAGCAGTIPTDTYTPQNYVRYNNQNEIDMGTFTYVPLTNLKSGLKSNQLQNTTFGNIYISTDVADMVKRGTALELEKTGLLLKDSANLVLTADILELKANDFGYSVHWTYKVRYKIQDKQTGSMLLSKNYHPPMKKTGKSEQPSDLAPVVHQVVLDGYDMFIRDPDVRALLDRPRDKK